MLVLCLGGPLALGACTTARERAEEAQQRQVQQARQICQQLGYTAGTTEFAQCSQSEFDRLAAAAPPPPAPVAAAPAPAAPAASNPPSEGWFENWIHKPPVCSHANCMGW